MLSYNPQNSLEEVEKRLGESRKISLTSRTTAKSIESVIQKLNKFAKANNENFNKFINWFKWIISLWSYQRNIFTIY